MSPLFFLGPTSRGLPLFKSRKIYVKSTVAYVLALGASDPFDVCGARHDRKSKS